jgi:hypothetical protein
MNEKSKHAGYKGWLPWAGLYAAVLLVLAGYLNYTQPYSSEPTTILIPWQLAMWALLYLPVIILPAAAGWQVSDFGFTLHPYLALTVPLISLL